MTVNEKQQLKRYLIAGDQKTISEEKGIAIHTIQRWFKNTHINTVLEESLIALVKKRKESLQESVRKLKNK
ncbi:hypothetical protein N9H19_03140 [Flavobacteriales bacterium]|nr:hypothetical protein [Flavobacteriales bacterium]